MNIDIMTASSTVRISTGRYTTEKEIDVAVRIISDKVLKLTS
jgi:cysteine sulfinate desulfinase/cysteine desulfurase-like protein